MKKVISNKIKSIDREIEKLESEIDRKVKRNWFSGDGDYEARQIGKLVKIKERLQK